MQGWSGTVGVSAVGWQENTVNHLAVHICMPRMATDGSVDAREQRIRCLFTWVIIAYKRIPDSRVLLNVGLKRIQTPK